MNLIVFYLSDIHLEFRKNKAKSFDVFVPTIDHIELESYFPYETCLLIAGDLGYPNHKIYADFLKFCKQRFNHVVLTSGNHEYYKQKGTYVTTESIDETIQQICSQLGCVYLQKSTTSIRLHDKLINIAGCTLWSHIPQDKKITAQMNMNDFSHIMTPEFKFWNCDDFNETHQDHLEWLKEILSTTKIDIVMTHYLPTFDLIPAYFKNSELNCCYASESFSSMHCSSVKYWVCGHSHESMQIVKNTTTFVLNPLGYPGEITHFNKQKYFVL
jgi:hypothetical protein